MGLDVGQLVKFAALDKELEKIMEPLRKAAEMVQHGFQEVENGFKQPPSVSGGQAPASQGKH